MAQVKAFFNKMKVDKMKEGRIKALFNAGFDTLEKILRATPKQLANVERMGEKSAQSLVDQLKDVLTSKPLTTVMAASSLFPGFGERKIDVILAVYPNLLEMEESPEELADLIAQIHGFGEKSIKFTSQLAVFKEWLEEHPMIRPVLPGEEEDIVAATKSPRGKPGASPQRKPTASPKGKAGASPQKIRPPTKVGDLTGFQIVFSGFRDAAAQKQIEGRGGKVTTAVSGKTTHLVLGDDSELKGKAIEAQKKGAQIVRWTAFKRQYGL
ncbi:MAG: helix-hairpin-helix domain-containing protein [Rickettsia endosymbiont of Ixodes persulcatus]|nr:helix-hairpin-helix domain-containing protein [Rickettsia endosymbiont of Ixodes persulcatus]